MTQPLRASDFGFLEPLREARRIINDGRTEGSMAAIAALSLLVKSFSGLMEEIGGAASTESRSRCVTLEDRLRALESDGLLPKTVLGDWIALMKTYSLWAQSCIGIELMTLDLQEDLKRLCDLTRWFLMESQQGPHFFLQKVEKLT